MSEIDLIYAFNELPMTLFCTTEGFVGLFEGEENVVKVLLEVPYASDCDLAKALQSLEEQKLLEFGHQGDYLTIRERSTKPPVQAETLLSVLLPGGSCDIQLIEGTVWAYLQLEQQQLLLPVKIEFEYAIETLKEQLQKLDDAERLDGSIADGNLVLRDTESCQLQAVQSLGSQIATYQQDTRVLTDFVKEELKSSGKVIIKRERPSFTTDVNKRIVSFETGSISIESVSLGVLEEEGKCSLEQEKLRRSNELQLSRTKFANGEQKLTAALAGQVETVRIHAEEQYTCEKLHLEQVSQERRLKYDRSLAELKMHLEGIEREKKRQAEAERVRMENEKVQNAEDIARAEQQKKAESEAFAVEIQRRLAYSKACKEQIIRECESDKVRAQTALHSAEEARNRRLREAWENAERLRRQREIARWEMERQLAAQRERRSQEEAERQRRYNSASSGSRCEVF